jgi:uncharacterized membrane protein
MVTPLRTAEPIAWDPIPPSGPWLPAAPLPLDDDRTATVSFDRDGRGLLTLTLDRPATDADLDTLEQAADLLPHLRLDDLDADPGYPLTHARAFGLGHPLARSAFNRTAEVELVAPSGRRLPSTLGAFGLPTRTTFVAPPVPAPARPARPVNGSRAERLLLAAGRALVARTRLSAWTLCGLALGACLAVFLVAFVRQTWTLHQRFATYGFDLGIYDQGTWLLSRSRAPFSTVRGLNLFGDHGTYVLALLAPLYRVWADPRLLLALQAVALAVPALVLYRLGARRLGHPAAGLAVAVAYLAYPAMQWAAVWQFHPETLAAAFLALAVLAADRGRTLTMAVLLLLAMACRDEVGLVVAGFGALLAATGKRDLGLRTALAGLGWFLATTFLLVPLANGRQTPLFELAYGVTGTGPLAVARALPAIGLHAAATALSNPGLLYLLLVFLPLLGLPLLAPRWLWPVAAPLLLNLASVRPEQHQIRYQYLAVAAPFLALAAVAGLGVVAARRRQLLAPLLVLLVLVAFAVDRRAGPALWSKSAVVVAASPADAARRAALATIDPQAPVSAQFNLVPHLTRRVVAYEFPNPFRAVNWGLPGDTHAPAEVAAVRYVIVEPAALSPDDRKLLDQLRASRAAGGAASRAPGGAAGLEWRTVFDSGGVLVLERQGGTAGGRGPADPSGSPAPDEGAP